MFNPIFFKCVLEINCLRFDASELTNNHLYSGFHPDEFNNIFQICTYLGFIVTLSPQTSPHIGSHKKIMVVLTTYIGSWHKNVEVIKV